MYCAQKSNKSLSRRGSALSLGLSLALSPSLTQRVAMPSLFLHRTSAVRVNFCSLHPQHTDPEGQGLHQLYIMTKWDLS